MRRSRPILSLLRRSVLKQLNPRVVRLVNELPEVDHPNEAIVARLFAHGAGADGSRGMRPKCTVPRAAPRW